MSGQKGEFDDELVWCAELDQIAPQAGGIGDDMGITRVGLAFAGKGVAHPVDGPPGHIDNCLLAGDQQCQQQRCLGGGQVHRPPEIVCRFDRT